MPQLGKATGEDRGGIVLGDKFKENGREREKVLDFSWGRCVEQHVLAFVYS